MNITGLPVYKFQSFQVNKIFEVQAKEILQCKSTKPPQGKYPTSAFSRIQTCIWPLVINDPQVKPIRAGVPNLGYMYPKGYICPSEGVHLSLLTEEQNIFAYDLFPNYYTYVSEYFFQKSLYAYC